jgi:hypothetical protein
MVSELSSGASSSLTLPVEIFVNEIDMICKAQQYPFNGPVYEIDQGGEYEVAHAPSFRGMRSFRVVIRSSQRR